MDPYMPGPPDSPRLFRPRGVGEILMHAFDLYRQHWQNLIALVAIIVVPLSALQILVSDVLIGDTFRTSEVRNGEVVVTGNVGAALLGALVVSVASILMWTILTGAVTRAAAGTFLGRDMDIAESYRFGLARFWSIVLVGLLMGVSIALGFILFVIPGFFILTRLTATLPALVVEGRRGTDALGRSWNLVAGHGWPVFGTIIVAALLTGLVGGLLTTPFQDNTFLRIVGQSISSIVTMPYTALVGILIYLDLRVRKERYSPEDLERDLASSAAPGR
jgi:hypothetical protein